MFLLDINVWLALVFDGHIHHKYVKSWFDLNKSGHCFFCRMTQQGFLRLSTNPAAFGDEAISMEKAWNIYDNILSDTRILYMNEPDGLEKIWREYTLRKTYSSKIWNDAYLAAFSRCSGLKLVTLDKGFHQYKKLDCLVLTEKKVI